MTMPDLPSEIADVVHMNDPSLIMIMCARMASEHIAESDLVTLSAYACAKRQLYQAAIVLADRAVELDPTVDGTKFARIRFMVEAGRYKDALAGLDEFSSWLSCQSEEVHTWYVDSVLFWRSVALIRLGRLDEALDTIDDIRPDLVLYAQGRVLSVSALRRMCVGA